MEGFGRGIEPARFFKTFTSDRETTPHLQQKDKRKNKTNVRKDINYTKGIT